MRIAAFSVTNFRGIRRAEADNLSGASIVTISGANGAGKSLLLDAINFLSRVGAPRPGDYDLSPLVGPWGHEAHISLDVTLNPDERSALAAFGADHGASSGEAPERLSIALVIEPGIWNVTPSVDEWGALLWGYAFSLDHGFAHVDYMPADRNLQRGEAPQVNPSIISAQQSESLRNQIVGSFIQTRQMITLTGIQPYLASLDYLEMLADRQGDPKPNDFATITDAFRGSTGKTIHRPRLDPSAPAGAIIEVETVTGLRHRLDQLSSGEQEALGLMFFVRRLSARGGLLLIDEPELHLHPALQRSLFAILEGIADRAQVWIVTHSPKLVTAARLDAILHMVPAGLDDSNQITKASEEEDRLRLLSELGIHPVDLLQSDLLVVVEGPTDTRTISAFLPVELSRAVIFEAGNAEGVERTCQTLSTARQLLPWIGIRDRDTLSDAESTALADRIPSLHVLDRRSLENELLHPPLIARTLERMGRAQDEGAVVRWLQEIAEGHRDDVVSEQTEAELRRRNPTHPDQRPQPDERVRAYLQASMKATNEKLRTFDEVRAEVAETVDREWSSKYLVVIDGKRALGELASRASSSKALFVAALAQTARDEPELLPPGLIDIRERLAGLSDEGASEAEESAD